MAISSKHKIYGGVLGAGLLALVADKAFLAPAGAAASDPLADEYAVAPTASVLSAVRSELDKALPVEPVEANNIIAELNRVAQVQKLDLDNIHDAFEPSKAWRPGSDNAIADSTSGDGPSSRFIKTHRLLAVMGSGKTASVIVQAFEKDTCLFIGQKIDGFALISVDEHVALFESDGLRVQIELLRKDLTPSQ